MMERRRVPPTSPALLITLAVMAGLPPTIAALAAFQQSRTVTAAVVVTDKKADAIVQKSDEIHTLVNSNLAAVRADLAVANEQIRALQTLVQTLLREQHPAPARAPPQK